MNQREYQTLVLAGLLHDVGKLLNKPDPRGKKHAVYSLELLQSSPYEDLLRRRFSDDLDEAWS
jgi:HD superfamily phosphodiesterase